MSTRMVGWALRDAPHAHPTLTMGARLVLIYLADHFNEDEGAAWPSQTRLAALMGCGQRSISRYLSELTTEGIITTQMREGKPNLYRLTYAKLAGVPTPNWRTGYAKLAPGVRQIGVLSNKELIKEQEPADPALVRATLQAVREELATKATKAKGMTANV